MTMITTLMIMITLIQMRRGYDYDQAGSDGAALTAAIEIAEIVGISSDTIDAARERRDDVAAGTAYHKESRYE